jgi:RNA polymerase sigma-70 factor (ECF subfamily)
VQVFLATRSEETIRLLFRRHTPALLRLAQRLLGGDLAAAEDVVQEVWIRSAARLADFRFESKLRTWLCGFAINRCREVLRSRSGAPVAAPSVETLEPASPVAAEANAASALDLERAVASLPDGYRSVFVLHDILGFTHREIAARLAIEEGTSKSQLFLARRALRRRLAGSPVREDTHVR